MIFQRIFQKIYFLSRHELDGLGGQYLRLNRDGSFTGEYSDFNCYAEDDFPKGTVTICEFEGKFTNIQRMDQYHYTMSLEKLEILDIPEKRIEMDTDF